MCQKLSDEVPQHIPFMYYGILTEENSRGVPSFRIPIKRFDPHRTRKIQFDGQYIGKVHGRFAYIRAAQNNNPLSLEKATWPSGNPCGLDELVAGRDYCIPVLTIDQQNRVQTCDSLFSTTPHKYTFEAESVVSIIDRFPPMARVDTTRSAIPNMAYGISLLTFPTSHRDCLQLPLEQLELLLLALQESQQLIVQECEGKTVPITSEGCHVSTIPLEIFFNLSPRAGGGTEHLYAKLYADLSDSGHSTMMEQAILTAKERLEEGEGCICCQCERGSIFEFGGRPMPFEQLRVAENNFGTLCVSYCPSYNFQLRVVPRRHVRTFTELTREEIRGNAELFRLGLFGLDLLKVTKNRRIHLTQCPAGYGPITDLHMYWSIDPLDPSFGGFDLLDDQKEVRIFPEAFAEELRKRFIRRRIISDMHEVDSAALEFHITAAEFSVPPRAE